MQGSNTLGSSIAHTIQDHPVAAGWGGLGGPKIALRGGDGMGARRRKGGGGLLPFWAVAGWGDQAPEYFSDAWQSMQAHVATFDSAAGGKGGWDDGDAIDADVDTPSDAS